MEYKQGAGQNNSTFPKSAANKQISVILKQEPGLENSLAHRFNIAYFTFFLLKS